MDSAAPTPACIGESVTPQECETRIAEIDAELFKLSFLVDMPDVRYPWRQYADTLANERALLRGIAPNVLVPGRYEVRDHAVKASKKAFHVWDRYEKREVFHTDNRERAEALVALAGDREITQHLKDHGHDFVATDRRGQCGTCAAPTPRL